MKTLRNQFVRVDEDTENVGRVALFGLILVLTLVVAAVQLLTTVKP